MIDSRRYLSVFAILSLVLLRLVIGWHFFGEGTKKVEYDQHDKMFRLAFSSEGFLTQATGPLAPWFHSQVQGDHGYRQLLAVPRRDVPPDAEASAEAAKWASEYSRRRAEAAKGDGEVPIEFPPHAPYHAWAEQIKKDWLEVRNRAKAVSELSDEQKKRVDEAFATRMQQVAEYFAGESDAISEYQHELWRLENWRSAGEAGDVPFHDERIATKAGETRSRPMAWINQVRAYDAEFLGDIRGVLTTEQRADSATASAMDSALTSEKQGWLHTVNVIVTVLTIGVGICLLLGFLTRLAAIAGALFLLAVIATQPPWIADAAPTMNQMIEFAGLLVLAGTGAGRWFGLDYFGWLLFRRRREVQVVTP